ncbi:regulatory protein AfsR [Microbispora rosea subsp. aerata]|nr:AfsR/SARP family transcriptional regulator [Microbispora rosea]GGO09756.1 regulatory protein AfsR [Microbispora rosea subsp. aerata]GIH53420.1 regulatory protein AfsR [Microbispora rosea subsp. aerata]GLJ83102.1 regulatory protein AfsR [Microbispora rosea subsp. aerata]
MTAWRDGRRVELGPPLQRGVLCLLAAQAGQVATKDALIGGLWGERPPKTAEQSVYTYVAGLRRILEPAKSARGPFSVLVSQSGGYVLARGSVTMDVDDFERLLGEARRLDDQGDQHGRLRALDAAIGCWAGPALCGVPGPFAQTERDRLEELRLTAREDRADALLRLNLHHEAAAALTELVGEAPLRERARDLLMLALYRCGRQADALHAYMDIKRLLAERLGVDPGQTLRERYELILRADPSLSQADQADKGAAEADPRSPHPPRQLPRAASCFVGRTEEMVRLQSLLAPWDGSAPQAVIAITGAPGAGKSALAIHAAHAAAHAFPDGQLYVNLLGATPGVERLQPIDVLGRLLRALGLPGEAVPSGVDEAAAMLRDRLEGRRTLIVLDDAAGPEQVRALLGLPSGTSVLITSRESFAVTDDCVQLVLGSMLRSEAVTVLAKLVGAERIAADPAAARLADLCGGLPLALRLAAARLVDRPQWTPTDLVERLQDRRRTLHELEAGQIAVRASLELSHESLARGGSVLDRLAARALCHLGVLRVPDVTAHVLAALMDEPADAAERALDRLVRAHLLEPAGSGRFRMHDLVRLYTIELADTRIAPEARKDALLRALGFYGGTARRASTLLDPHRVQLPWPDVPQRPAALGSSAEARNWLEEELANVVAAASQALASDDDDVARMGAYVAFALYWQLSRNARTREHLDLGSQALAVGERTGDREIMSLAHGQLSSAFLDAGRGAEAMPHQRAELRLRRELGDRFGEMRALGNLAVTHLQLQQYAQARECTETQRAIAREIGSEVGERHSLLIGGEACRGLGETTEAMNLFGEGLALAHAAGDRYQEGFALVLLSRLHLDRGDPLTAKSSLERGLRCALDIGHRVNECQSLVLLARAHRLLGEREQALALARRALAVARSCGQEELREAEAELRAAEAAFAGSSRRDRLTVSR